MIPTHLKKKLTFGSVCSGIEGASVAWEPLGWKAKWVAEIEPFPSAVIAHHYPDVPNLGDMTKIAEKIRSGEVAAPAVIVGGTPCQSWSVAGLRKGSADARGQLTYRFVELVEAAQPKWVVWENVPGIISAEGGAAFCQFLDALTGLGYLVNCDCLDSQHFGVAQRRRRVFVVCQRADILMRQKTHISASVGATIALEILHDILAAQPAASVKGLGRLGVRCADVNAGLQRKTRCFLAHGKEALQAWLDNCAEAWVSAATEPASSESSLGGGTETAGPTKTNAGTRSSASRDQETEDQASRSSRMLQLLKMRLAALFDRASAYTTSTETNPITDLEILSYAKMLPIIGAYIARSNFSSPHSWKAESSYSTVLRRLTVYAGQPDSVVLRDARVRGRWDAVIQKARRQSQAIASARKGFSPSTVLFEREGVRRDSPPSREAREGTAEGSAGGVRSGKRAVVTWKALRRAAKKACLAAGDSWVSDSGAKDLYTADAWDALGRPEIVDAPEVKAFDWKNDGEIDVSPTLDARLADGPRRNHGGDGQTAAAKAAAGGTHQTNYIAQAVDCYNHKVDGDVCATFGAASGGSNNAGPKILEGASRVRRLTPEECEALQAFPRGWTKIPWKNKPADACPDGPRYKALGNSWTVNVVRWIGARIVWALNGADPEGFPRLADLIEQPGGPAFDTVWRAGDQANSEVVENGTGTLNCNLGQRGDTAALPEVAYGFEPGIARRTGDPQRFVTEMAPTLRRQMGDNQTAVAFNHQSGGDFRPEPCVELANTLQHSQGQGVCLPLRMLKQKTVKRRFVL